MDVMKENKMKNIDEYLYKYGLHDCVVERIYAQNNSLVFCFGQVFIIWMKKELKQ